MHHHTHMLLRQTTGTIPIATPTGTSMTMRSPLKSPQMSKDRRLNRMDLLILVSKALITPDTVTATLTASILIMVHTTTKPTQL